MLPYASAALRPPQVRDLLVGAGGHALYTLDGAEGAESKRSSNGSLRVRESPTLGVYVEGLLHAAVADYGDVQVGRDTPWTRRQRSLLLLLLLLLLALCAAFLLPSSVHSPSLSRVLHN